MSETILSVNGGSSSIKFAFFHGGPALTKIRSDSISGIKSAQFDEAIESLFKKLSDCAEFANVSAIGHRIVHSGTLPTHPQIVTAELIQNLKTAISFAPNHLPNEIKLIEAFQKHCHGITQFVCFDTHFHRTLPNQASRFPIPIRFHEAGIKRYGFHGLSFEYLMHQLRKLAGDEIANGKVILAHLGSGSSLAAVRNGQSIDTTMGLTPTGGLMMATRSGDLDPGVLIHILRNQNCSIDQLETILVQESGLLAVSESTADMKEIVARKSVDPKADLAFQMYCYSARKQIGAMAAALDGVDTLVFAGGIGEHAAEVRSVILEQLQFLGVRIDHERNRNHEAIISANDSPCTVRVIPTDEEWMMAQLISQFNDSRLTPGIAANAK